MTLYEYTCFDCGYLFGKEYKFGKAANRARCYECNQLCNRNYSNQSIHFIGQDWHTNQAMERRSRNSKTDCKKAWEVLHESTKRSVNQATTGDYYKQPGINWDVLAKQGKARRLSSKELEQRGHAGAKAARECHEAGHIYKVKDN